MIECVLDTNTLSEVLAQRDAAVMKHARQYVRSHGVVQFSAITRYEIVRGHRLRGSMKLLQSFERFCEHNRVLPVNDVVLDIAADLWCQARRTGESSDDADLIIAATAIHVDCVLVTSNLKHFEWISSLRISDWRAV
jgi:tRNA(fMet)-specific endonuclease VapC